MPPIAAPTPLAVIIMGVSGCGKTTVGTLLAEALHCPFLEGDHFHAREAVAKMRSGQPLSDEDRWPWLERIGAATAQAISGHGIAVAACSALRKTYRDRLRATIGGPVWFVLLDIARDPLLQRLAGRGGHFMPATLLDSQLATLERPLAEDDVTTLVTDEAPERLRDLVLALLAGASPQS